MHDGAARLDEPGVIRFVTMCAACGREIAEVARQAYVPEPRLEASGRRVEGEALVPTG